MGRKRRRLSMADGWSEDRRHFHVVGIRADQTEAVMGSGLSMAEAKRVRDALIEANVFTAVLIRRGEPKNCRD